MAEYGGNHIARTDADEHGNPVKVTDAGVEHMQQDRPGHAGTTTLEPFGSSSSSSSEDDGQGGRRKKLGLKDKVKEKLPGGARKEHQEHGIYGTGHEPEKKGTVEKIKELPGNH